MANSLAFGLPPITLVLVRHGETDWNAERRLQGQQNIPLNPKGREQAARNGQALRSLEGIESFDFVASPLDRAAETMKIMRAELGLDPDGFRSDPGLVEITFGAWEGFTLEELSIAQADNVRKRQADKWGYVPPGGESYEMLTERMADWLGGVTANTVAVSHGAVARVIQGLLFGTPHTEVPVLPSPQDTVMVYREGSARWI